MEVTECITWMAVVQSNFSLILHIVEIVISSEFFATDIWVFFLVVWVGFFGVGGGGVFGWFLGGGVFVLVGYFSSVGSVQPFTVIVP